MDIGETIVKECVDEAGPFIHKMVENERPSHFDHRSSLDFLRQRGGQIIKTDILDGIDVRARAFLDSEGKRDRLLLAVDADERVDCSAEESLILVVGPETGIVLVKQRWIEVFGLVTQLLTDLVEKLPETGWRLSGADDTEKDVLTECFIALEAKARDFELLRSHLRMSTRKSKSKNRDNIADATFHDIVKKKPSHETLGSMPALSVIKEGNLT